MQKEELQMCLTVKCHLVSLSLSALAHFLLLSPIFPSVHMFTEKR